MNGAESRAVPNVDSSASLLPTLEPFLHCRSVFVRSALSVDDESTTGSDWTGRDRRLATGCRP